jgi:archaellum component FlaC
METISFAIKLLTTLAILFAITYLGVLHKRLESAHRASLDLHKAEIESLERRYADVVFAYDELEKRIIDLEHFNESEGKEIMEALREQNKQEKLFSQGMENIINYGLQTPRKG